MSTKHKRIFSKLLIPFIFSAEFSWAFLSIAFGIPLVVYGFFSVGGVLFAGYLNSGIN
jgi:hypothetical protein